MLGSAPVAQHRGVGEEANGNPSCSPLGTLPPGDREDPAADWPRDFDEPARGGLAVYFSALRPHHWAKNLLVLLPLFLAHQVDQLSKLLPAFLALAAFCCVASAGYVVNDLLDRDADRRHPTKRLRPFAAGILSARGGVALAGGIGLLGFALAWACVSAPFTATLAVYVALSAAYSWFFKKQLLVDVVLLAGLYTLRLIAGAAATEVPLSPWLLAFAMFFFLSLAFGKRYVELGRLAAGAQIAVPGRGYFGADAALFENVGPTSGYLAVLVFCLYIDSNAVRALYPRPWWLWGICPLLVYWITRFWLLARRKQVHEDPVVFALNDKASLGLIVVTAAIVLIAAA